MNNIKVFAPASIANVGSGFDILGFAVEAPGDVLEIYKNDAPGVRIINETQHKSIPLNPEQNCAGKAVLSLLQAHPVDYGVTLVMKQKIPPGSGLGSSAASAVAGVVAANHLLGNPFSAKQLLPFAIDGEFVASGARHADNVAPALFGGLCLIRSVDPLDVVQLDSPSNLFATVLLPDISIKTDEARAILPKEIPLKQAVNHWGNVAGLIAGFLKHDVQLIARSMVDEIVEPQRSKLIPKYDEVRYAAIQTGAFGCSISGAGPAIFALSTSPSQARKIGKAMRAVYQKYGLAHSIYAGQINQVGPRILSTVRQANSLNVQS